MNLEEQLHSGPGQTQMPAAGLEVALTESCPVLGATALQQALRERSSSGAATVKKESRKRFEKM